MKILIVSVDDSCTTLSAAVFDTDEKSLSPVKGFDSDKAWMFVGNYCQEQDDEAVSTAKKEYGCSEVIVCDNGDIDIIKEKEASNG